MHSKCLFTSLSKSPTGYILKSATEEVNQSHYRLEMPRGFQEVKVPRLRDNGPEWW